MYNDEWMRENQMLDADRATLGMLVGAKQAQGGHTVVSVAPATPVRQAIRLMSAHDLSQLPVMDGDTCVGSVTETQLTTRALDDAKVLDEAVSAVMDAPYPIMAPNQPVESIAKLLSKTNRAVLVRSNGHVDGIVTRSDVLQYLMAR
jgi:cystathionine beta-synthase